MLVDAWLQHRKHSETVSVDAWLQHRKHSETVSLDAWNNCTGLPVLIYLFKGTETAVVINSTSFNTSYIRKAKKKTEI